MKFFIRTKAFYFLALVTLLQQLIVAASTYFLIRLTSAESNSQEFIGLLFGFIGALTLVYIPVSMQKYLHEKWVLVLQEKYLSQFKHNYRGRIDLLGNSAAQEQKFGFLQKEAFHVIDQVTFYFVDALTTSLNVILNIAVIGATLEKSFFGAYLASFIVYAILAFKFAKYLNQWSSENQNVRVAHASLLNKIWPTLLIGNSINTQQLSLAEKRRFESLSRVLLKNRRKTETIQVLTTLLTMVPVLGLLIYLFIQGLQNPVLLVPLIVTLHRQIQVVQHIEVLGSLGLHYHSLVAMASGFLTSLQSPASANISERIQTQLIQFRTAGNRTLVTGPNGAGKSSWLKLKKLELGDKAVYIPANMDLYFEDISDEMSTGQRAIAILKSIESESEKGRVYLFDEWDANMDLANREAVSKVIDKIAETNIVYEVRHG